MNDEWYKHPMIIVDFIPPEVKKYEALDTKDEYKIKADLGFNTEHIEVHDITVGESGITYYPSKAAVENRKDILGEIRKEYDSDIIRQIVYFNVHWISPSLSKIHPDWLERDIHNEVIPSSYGVGGYTCINSPFREYAFETMRILGSYGIHGVFLDGPVVHEKGCFCRYCREKFQKEYGYEIKELPFSGTKEDVDWFDFKKQSIAEFLKDTRRALKEADPDAIIYMNNPQLVQTRLCSRDNRLTLPYQDMLLAEGGFLSGDLRKLKIWKPAATAMLLESQAQGKPYCVAISGRLAPWTRYMLTPSETKIAYAMAVANGAWTWYGAYNDNKNDMIMDTVKEINWFLKDNAYYYENTASVAKIALVWSYNTANYYQTSSDETDFTREVSDKNNSKKGDYKSSFNGWFDVLSRSHQIFDVIDDTSLINGDINNYNLVIMPAVSCISEEQAECIDNFVKNGGNIISTFDTGFYDEHGIRYNVPALKSIIGIDGDVEVRRNQYDHIDISPEKHPLFQGITQKLIPAAVLGVKCEALKDGEAVSYFREPQMSRYCELPEKSLNPYIVYNRYGKGKSIYFTGNVDSFYDEYSLPEYRILLNNAVDMQNDRILKLECEAESVHVSYRKKENKQIIHLINYTGSMTRPITNVVKLEDIKLTIFNSVEKDMNIQVHSLRKKKELDFRCADQNIEICIDELDEYDVIVVDQDWGRRI